MPLETGTLIKDLVVTNPAHTDGLNTADAHLRLLKATIKNNFPNLTAPVTLTADQLNALYSLGIRGPSGSADAPAMAFSVEPGLGFYRSAAAQMAYTGRLFGNGVVPPGALMDFAMATPPAGWLPCDGQVLLVATYPDLFAALGYLYGGSGTQFQLPNMQDRYRRHRSASLAGLVGNFQEDTFGAHSHGATGTALEAGAHTHYVTGTTYSMNRNAAHSHGISGGFGGITAPYLLQAGDRASVGNPAPIAATATNTDHEHVFEAITAANGSHTHGLSITVAGNGSAETRPKSLSVLTCIKT